MTRPIVFAVLAVSAAAVVGCDRDIRITTQEKPRKAEAAGPAYKTLSRLDCPEAQGDLKRISAAADGKACAYAADDGSEVALRLEPDTVLASLEDELKALVPPPPPKARPAAEITADEANDAARIRLPGLSIDARGENAEINIGGLRIGSQGDHADVQVQGRNGGVNIVANDHGAEIRQSRDGAKGVQRTLILASEQPAASGYRLVGYEARGPKQGPLVVAVVRTKTERDTDYVFKDMKALVARNAGK